MLTLNLKNNNNKSKNIKKSHLLLIGSLFIFLGILVLTFNHLEGLREEVFSDMDTLITKREEASKVKVVNTNTEVPENLPATTPVATTTPTYTPVDYSKYYGVLEIPKIWLKRGFYSSGKYNNIQYNVTFVPGSDTPDVVGGNLVLIAHSGDAYISYFAYLYKLNLGDVAYITMNNTGAQYMYSLVKKYDVPKSGSVVIDKTYGTTTLTLITCTKNSDNQQTVYIFQLA
jgi:LPXTG-site transpeptidase (sortase) family protein